MKLKQYIINEAAYPGNIGFEELVKFYQIASESDIKKMEEIIKNEDWDGFRLLIKKIIHVSLR